MEKIIHQIWVGPYCPPEREKKWADNIRAAHPDFEYVFWHNGNLPRLPEQLNKIVAKLDARKKWESVADVFRYWIVNELGGIYIDIDYELLHALHDLELHRYDGFLPLHLNPGETICNSVFGFKKNHRIIQHVVNEMFLLDPEKFAGLIEHVGPLGPFFFGKAIKESIGFKDTTPDAELLDTFAKLNIKTVHSRQVFQEKYCRHHYAYTWHPLNQAKLTPLTAATEP